MASCLFALGGSRDAREGKRSEDVADPARSAPVSEASDSASEEGEASSPPEAAREDPWCSDALRVQTEPLLPAVADAARRLRATVFSPRGAPPLSSPPSPLDLDPPTAVTPLDPSRVPSPLHATLGRILRAAANARDRDDPRDVRAAAARMELVCRAVLVFCGALLERDEPHPPHLARDTSDADTPHPPHPRETHPTAKKPCPPLGSHLIRRCDLPCDPRVSLYVQDQCSYVYDDVARTADHFIDGDAQRARASMKIVAAPEANAEGVAMRFRMRDPPPFPPDARVDRDVFRGCFVELGGASGHPDHLRRAASLRRAPEVYAFNLPDIHVADFARGAPVARLVGRVEVTCERTGLAATMDLKLPDADADPAVGGGGAVVSGSVRDETGKQGAKQQGDQQQGAKQQGDAKQQGTDDKRSARVLRVLLGTLDGGVYSAAALDREEVRTVCPPAAPRGGALAAATALRHPGAMTLHRLWHACVDAAHADDTGEPCDSVKHASLAPLGSAAAAMQRGDAEGYVGGGTNGNAKRRMRYESAFLLADAPPPDAPPPLPRVWDPARRNERGNGRGEDQTDADADAE